MALNLALTAPRRWRFTDVDDIAAYGDRWWIWNPAAVSRLPARQLIEIEEAIGIPWLAVLEQQQGRTTLGALAALWISMHQAGTTVAWDEFSPLVFTTEWEEVPAEPPLDSGAAPTPDSSSSPAPATESATS